MYYLNTYSPTVDKALIEFRAEFFFVTATPNSTL